MQHRPFYHMHDLELMTRAAPEIAAALDNIAQSGPDGAALVAFAESARIGFQFAPLGERTAGHCRWSRSYSMWGGPNGGRYAMVQVNPDKTIKDDNGLSVEHVLVHELTHAAQHIIHDALEVKPCWGILPRLLQTLCGEAAAELAAARILHDIARAGDPSLYARAEKSGGPFGHSRIFTIYDHTYTRMTALGAQADEARAAASAKAFETTLYAMPVVLAYADSVFRPYAAAIAAPGLDISGSHADNEFPNYYRDRFTSLHHDVPQFSAPKMPDEAKAVFPFNRHAAAFAEYLDFVRIIWINDRHAESAFAPARAAMEEGGNPFIDLDLGRLLHRLRNEDTARAYTQVKILDMACTMSGIEVPRIVHEFNLLQRGASKTPRNDACASTPASNPARTPDTPRP